MVCLWERSLPSAEEYLKNGIVSSGVHIVMVHAFSLLGHGLTEENVQIIDRNPVIISSPATILRLWDDLGNAEDVNGDGNYGLYMKCYMKEHPHVSIEQTREHVTRMISDAWKRLNQECLMSHDRCKSFTIIFH
ncbi:hypothetical protein JHK82_020599 [Glycine max]|nr:hypothetical protein GLYMA_08G061550v4 [Glycine max]KAG5014918.1 hypothetical protein JHK85_021054 [Glycine max]KAG5135868.1 hypothetical protein JHK82_020599 [Glycine max]KAH1049889.1 hypothetical protein GYH30_020405 [Glycine max]